MSYRTGYKIHCNKFSDKAKKAMREFLNWLKDNDNVSEYDTENITTELALGCIVDQQTVRWHSIKGLFYDFFDFNYICVEIGIDKTMEPKYCFEISTHKDFEWDVFMSDLYYTRIEAEEEAFIKAFELLEEKLK